jgi:hypothetical protein
MVEPIFYIREGLHKVLCLGVAHQNDERGIGTAYVILVMSTEV